MKCVLSHSFWCAALQYNNRRGLSSSQRDAVADAEKAPVGGGILRFATPTMAYKLLNYLLLGIIIIQVCINLSFAGSAFGTYEVQRPICKVTPYIHHMPSIIILC